MFLAIALTISIALVVFVVAPLLAPQGAEERLVPIDVTPLADLKRRRLVVYENIQDLEFEYKAGKIAAEDYQSLRESYPAGAAELMLASQEAEHPVSTVDAFIEREVAARRARRKPKPPGEYICSKCGFENPLPVKFCGNCGAKIKSSDK